ncbi:MAG: hypothetical protein E7359_00195 [Clostridiales bacterium]|nr:hypothetical protein [Clostridiales bacterium]
MKIKKVLLSFLIIFMGSIGLLFGCTFKPVKLSVYYENEVIETLDLEMPTGFEPEVDPDDPDYKVIENKKTVIIKAEDQNKMFENGLDFLVSKNNIVSVNFLEKTADGYAYEILALYPDTVNITFQTKDGKSKTNLNVNISQDIVKIEENIKSNNYVVLGVNKEINSNIIKFTPSTTTKRNVVYQLSENYQGIKIENNMFVFDPNIENITLNGSVVDSIYVNVMHEDYIAGGIDNNFIVSNIKFDVLKELKDIALINTSNSFVIEEFNFATNRVEDNYNFVEVLVKKKIFKNNDFIYEDLDDSYEIKYYLVDSENNIVNIEENVISNDKFTISQNFRDGINTLVVYAQNKIQPEYKSNEVQIPITIKTYPTYISVNGLREPEETILYDNGKKQELEIVVGSQNSFDTRFKVVNYSAEFINLTYQNGQTVIKGSPILSGTKLYVNLKTDAATLPQNGSTTSIELASMVDEIGLTKTITCRFVRSLEDVYVRYNNATSNFEVAKLDTFGNNTEAKFEIFSQDDIYIPRYSVTVENENIVSLLNTNYENKTFTLKALTTGKTKVTLNFENGYTKEIEVSVFTPVESFKIDVDEITKNNYLGQIVYEDGILSSFALKVYEKAQLVLKAYDKNNNLILDKNIYTVNYELVNNNNNIIVSNVDNKVSALQETSQDVTVIAKISAKNESGKVIEHSLSFKVSVYIPVKTITLSETYVSLYAESSLGFGDKDLSKASIEVIINPTNASKVDYNKIQYHANFVTDADIETNAVITDKYVLNVIAKDLKNQTVTTTGTITFTIYEFDIIYTRKVTIKVTKPQSPETILLDNINKIEEDGVKQDYLYFNLGQTSEIELNPRVYPLNSYNTNYKVIIKTNPIGEDPILFNQETGKVTPVKAGECELILVPTASFISETDYKENCARKIKVIVADGETIPYKISTKEELLQLCSTNIVEDSNHADRYSKKYILTSDIDMTGENIFPIGVYAVNNNGITQYKKVDFTGSFSGKFTVGNIEKQYTISGLNIVNDFGEVKNLNNLSNEYEYYLGLFAHNKGQITGLNVYYSKIDAVLSVNSDEITSIKENSMNKNYSFYFGAIAGINSGTISSCQVNVYSGTITTYLGNENKANNIGLIAGINTKDAIIESCKASGNLNVLDGFSKYQKSNNLTLNTKLKILVGGLVGENIGSIVDNFNIYSGDNEVFNKDKINVTATLSSVLDNDLLYLNNSCAFGLIVGLNSGTIGDKTNKVGLSTYGQVLAYSNVGGVAGINKGNIYSCFTASTLKANNNVGGLIGNQTGAVGEIINNAVVFLDDNTNNVKIYGEDFVAGLIGSACSITLENNFVTSFVSETKENISLSDVVCNGDNFGGIYCGDGYTNIAIVKNNVANFKLNKASNTYQGSAVGVGIVAPESITVDINDTTLVNADFGFNKFINASVADEKLVVLYYYDLNLANYNNYLQSYIFSITSNYPGNSEENQQLSMIQLESLNKDVLNIDSNGVITVRKPGVAQIHIYSLLNRKAEETITIKVLDAIERVQLFKDSLSKSEITKTLLIEKDTTHNIYLNTALKQDDIYLQYVFDGDYIAINDGKTSTDYYKSVNAQVVRALSSGTTNVTINVFVKINDRYCKIDYLSYNFNIIVSEGLKEANLSVYEGTLVPNSGLDFTLEVQTGLKEYTMFVVEQYDEKNTEGEFLNLKSDKTYTTNGIIYHFKASVKDTTVEKVTLKFFIYDSFVTIDQIKNNVEEYSKHIKTLTIYVDNNNFINLDISYFADGELTKDEFGNDIINVAELESNFIKIGKIGILKLNIYPIENLQSLTVSYSNNDNYNLNFKQVKKSFLGYEDVNTSEISGKTIKLDINKDYIDGSYLYLKLLTDSPINENSEFNLRVNINNSDYYYEKVLTSKLTTNLDISFDNATLNSSGILEGVYARGAKDEQIITLTTYKLNNYIPIPKIVNNLSSSLALISKTVVSEDITVYKYVIENLINNNESFEVYFEIDKLVNNKKEKYLSNTLKLNVVEFVVTNVAVEDVDNNYFTKPYGLDYDLKVKLETINNGHSDVLNKIKDLEAEIAGSCDTNVQTKANYWFNNNEKLAVNNYNNFIISRNNGYFNISPKTIFKGENLASKFAISYKLDNGEFKTWVNTQPIENITNSLYIKDGVCYTNFEQKFGLNFYLQTDINNPVPVYTVEEFLDMKAKSNYILMNDLVLEDYAIKEANFNSFDGNGKTITIKSFNVDLSNTKEEFNFGLFDVITEDALIKNLNIKLDLTTNDLVENSGGYTTIKLSNIKTLYFGALAAKNNGLVYNCSVEKFIVNGNEDVLSINVSNIIEGLQTKAYIASLIAQNNGIISNSRSELKLRTNKGYLSGFVAYNSGTITSSYLKNAIITNLGEDETTSTTAGFVNVNEGDIKYSYVEGESNNVDGGRLLSNQDLSNYCITAPTSVGGFVFENSGNIEDCYANLSITSQSFSGGFVYSNSGTITRCYAANKNENENSEAHAPFIAIKVEINEIEMKKQIKDCFYLNTDKSTINDNLVTGLTLKQFNNEYYLTNFVFDDTGIWMFRDETLTPTLISANDIAESVRSLFNSYVDSSGSAVYTYKYDKYYAGHEKNPTIISSEEEFLAYFTSSLKTNNYFYRLINNINFSAYSNLPTSKYVFSGRLDGNGLTISGISISASSDFDKSSFGLFSEIKQQGSVRPVVKNLILEPLEVYANNVQKVGTIAGSIYNADIINITINAKNIIVQGKNIVGGVVGEVLGNSKIININSDISVNANFVDVLSNENRIYIDGDYVLPENDGKLNNTLINYAGGICGVVNVDSSDDKNENIRNIVVNSGVKTIGQFVGLGFGLICEDSGVDNVKVYADSSSYLNSTYAAGIVVGENRGYISRAETLYSEEEDQELTIFKNRVYIIGGIVGFNNNGTIVNSIARVSTISKHAETTIAGGVVGLAVGGSISSVIAINNVYSSLKIGGIVGQAGIKSNLCSMSINEQKKIVLPDGDEVTIKENNVMYIANAIALNQFREDSLKNEKYIGAMFGAVQNTIQSSGGSVEIAHKISYIMENNYYITHKITWEEPEIANTGDMIYNAYKTQFTALGGEIVYDANGKMVYETKERYIYDYGYYACNVFEDFGFERKNDENSCAKRIGKTLINPFTRFSSNIFDNISNAYVSATNLDYSKIPTLKSTNNINVKKLEGEGTFANPYLVDSVMALNDLAEVVETGNNQIFVNLTDNIEATGKEIKSLGNDIYNFNGTFNGNNNFINGLTYINDIQKYSTSNYFGLFGVVGTKGIISNVNIVANFVINYGKNVQYTGIIAGLNQGYIANCNVYGGVVGRLKQLIDTQTSAINALSYVGGIAGVNIGTSNTRIIGCSNYAIIDFAVQDIEQGITNLTSTTNIKIYAAFIAGANLNKAAINNCKNYQITNYKINSGAEKTIIYSVDNSVTYPLTLIVTNATNNGCKNYIGHTVGYKDAGSSVAEIVYSNDYDYLIYSVDNETNNNGVNVYPNVY